MEDKADACPRPDRATQLPTEVHFVGFLARHVILTQTDMAVYLLRDFA